MTHKKVQIVIIDCSRKGPKVLLLQTNEKRGLFWQNVTGSVEGEETLFSAAKRELMEETGIDTDNIFDLDLKFHFEDRYGKKVIEQAYVALLQDTPTEINLDPHEHVDYKWKNLDAITEVDFKFPTNFEAFIKAKARVH